MNPIQLKYECPEKWENMKIGMISRHCTNCNKDVHDFTQFTREQIIDFLLKNEENQVCARVYKSQLDFSREEMLISINHIIRKNKNPNYALYLLAVSTFLLASCDKSEHQEYSNNGKQKYKAVIYTEANTSKVKELIPSEYQVYLDLINKKREEEKRRREKISATTGIILFQPIDLTYTYPTFDYTQFLKFNDEEKDLVLFPDSTAYFSIDDYEIQAYFHSYLNYGEFEIKKKVKGIIFVSVIIDKDGKIQNPQIVQTIDNAKYFEQKILMALASMPNWQPAIDKGKAVNT